MFEIIYLDGRKRLADKKEVEELIKSKYPLPVYLERCMELFNKGRTLIFRRLMVSIRKKEVI
jgi:hypothetical protein